LWSTHKLKKKVRKETSKVRGTVYVEDGRERIEG
jgi:hypothetical protein